MTLKDLFSVCSKGTWVRLLDDKAFHEDHIKYCWYSGKLSDMPGNIPLDLVDVVLISEQYSVLNVFVRTEAHF